MDYTQLLQPFVAPQESQLLEHPSTVQFFLLYWEKKIDENR